MYLARGVLNPASRDVQQDLADAVHLHRTIMRVFADDLGDNPRKAVGALHRIDEDRRRGEVILFLQSREHPDFSRLPPDYFVSVTDDLDRALAGDTENPQVRSTAREQDAIVAGDRFVFRLRANTTKKILTKTQADGQRQNGKRVPLRGEEARLGWLARRASKNGFRVEGARVSEAPRTTRGREDDRRSFEGVTFDGMLAVTDALPFRDALQSGIGPAKAFGFGLLSLSRIGRE